AWSRRRRCSVVFTIPVSRPGPIHRCAQWHSQNRTGTDLLHLAWRYRFDLCQGVVREGFFPIIMLHTGFDAVDADKIKLVRLFGASHRQVLWKIVLPASVPTMVSTLQVNVGLALVGVIVGEFQAAKAGLGYLITYGSQIFKMNLVMAAIVILAVIS